MAENPRDYATARVTLYAKKLMQIYRGHEGVKDSEVISPLVIEMITAWAAESEIPIPTPEEFYEQHRDKI